MPTPQEFYNNLNANSLATAYGSSGPAFQQVTSIPDWLPPERTSELESQYRNTNTMFDTGAYDQASQAQESRILTSALSGGNNAAAEYANRARQSGGSGLGAGLVKAEAQTGARTQAGAMEMERHRYDTEQREAAATHATAIATTLGQLRDSYLKSIVSYATATDSTNASFTAQMAALRGKGGANGGRGGDILTPGAMIGSGMPSGGELKFDNYTQYLDYLKYIKQNYGMLGG